MHEFLGIKGDFVGVEIFVFAPTKDKRSQAVDIEIEGFVGNGIVDKVGADRGDDFVNEPVIMLNQSSGEIVVVLGDKLK